MRKKPPTTPTQRPTLTKPGAARRFFTDVPFILVGSALYALAVRCFTEPNNIAPGGVTGIATILSDLTGLNLGMLYGLLNVPLIILGFFKLGKFLMLRTLLAVGAVTLLTDYAFVSIPVYQGDRMLASLFGGVLLGAALGLIYLREGTTGGMDIVNKIINKKYPHISLGTITLATDAVIVLAATLYYGGLELGLYAIVTIFVSARVLDLLLYGSTEGKLLLIFSESYRLIADSILNEHNRGVTFLKGSGAYSGKEKSVICCAVQRGEYVKIRRRIREIDPAAFIITARASEVAGQGFSEL